MDSNNIFLYLSKQNKYVNFFSCENGNFQQFQEQDKNNVIYIYGDEPYWLSDLKLLLRKYNFKIINDNELNLLPNSLVLVDKPLELANCRIIPSYLGKKKLWQILINYGLI